MEVPEFIGAFPKDDIEYPALLCLSNQLSILVTLCDLCVATFVVHYIWGGVVLVVVAVVMLQSRVYSSSFCFSMAWGSSSQALLHITVACR